MKHYKHDISIDSRPYVESVDVKCPSCKGKATASQDGLNCLECHFQIKEKWFGPVSGIAACSCSKCKRSLYRRFSHQKNQLNYRFRCPICSTVNNASISWFKRHIDGKDPYFGLDYYTKIEFQGSRFWIHNKEHKDALKVYIDTEQVGNISEKMAKSLPECVKDHRNRSELLKLIDKLDD